MWRIPAKLIAQLVGAIWRHRLLYATACALAALAWLRPSATLDAVALVLWLLFVIVVPPAIMGAGYIWRSAQVSGLAWPLRIAAAPIIGAVMVAVAFLGLCVLYWLSCFWIGAVGQYVIPPLPDILGIVLCLGALVLGIGVLVKRDWAGLLAVTSCLVALSLLWTAFVYDAVTRSPCWVVRSFARSAYRCDQQGVNRFLSAESLAHFSELPRTVCYRHGERLLVTAAHLKDDTAADAMLLDVEMEGERAKVRVGWRLGQSRTWLTPMGGFSGRSFDVYLVREGSTWKIDLWTPHQERQRRWELR